MNSTHCKHGHEYLPENTIISRNGRRSCRACACQTKRAWRQRRAPEYMARLYMRYRCSRKDPAISQYYARLGISVCDQWRDDYSQFLADMGPKPFPGATLDRIDSNLGYSPANCRWADRKTQSRNQRRTLRVNYRGQEMLLIEACELAGVKYRTATKRLQAGRPWGGEQA